jgi:hypothetical protein
MGDPVEYAAGLDTPWTWLICFHRDCRTWWINRLVPGRFKHVTAIGYSPIAKVWIFYDPAIDRTRISVMQDGDGTSDVLAAWIRNATVVSVNLDVAGHPAGRWRLGLWCVPIVAQLIGLRSGAVLPSRLLRDCLRHGGRIVQNEGQRSNPSTKSSSDSTREFERPERSDLNSEIGRIPD